MAGTRLRSFVADIVFERYFRRFGPGHSLQPARCRLSADRGVDEAVVGERRLESRLDLLSLSADID